MPNPEKAPERPASGTRLSRMVTEDRKFDFLFNQANDAIYLWSVGKDGMPGTCLEANEYALNMLGYSLEEMRKMTPADLDTKDSIRNIPGIMRILKRQKQITFEAVHVSKTGREVPVEINSHLFNLNGNKVILSIARDINIRKQNEAELRESEEKFRLLFETEKDAIVVINLHSMQIEDANPAALELYGYTHREMIGMPAADLSADRTKSAGILKYLSENKSMKPEFSLGIHIKKDGTVFPIEAAAARFEWQNQQMLHAVFRDVSAREAAEKSLRASERKFRQLFEYLPDAVFISHIMPERDGEIVDFNQAAVDQTGYSRKELTGMNINRDLRIDPPEDISGYRDKLLNGEKVVFVEKKRRKNGSEYPTEVHITTIEQDGQKFAISVNRDITAQHQAEELLRKLSRSVEQSPVSVLITDREGRIEYINPKFTSVTGYSEEEALGKTPRILKSGEMNDSDYTELWSTILAGREWQGELHNRKKNGELFWEYASISPIKDEYGEITHFLAIKEDITERKRLQQELIQVQKMESIGNLAGGIAHDFNNLLTVINGHAEIGLMKLEKEHPAHRDLVSILHGGKRAENLTRQLLAFSRKQIYETKTVDVNTVIGGLEKMLRRLIGEDISIDIRLDRSTGMIKADPVQIEQVVINIVVNARDAINECADKGRKKRILIETGEIYLDDTYIRKRPEVERGRKVFIAISDTGKGMNRETRNRIFEPFFTTKEKGKGTGLGLATVYGIVKQNRGNIYVYSEPGYGTTFRIYWPLSGETEQSEKSDHEDRKALGGSERLLLVEDDDTVRAFALNALKEFGYTVHEAQNGRSALKFVREHGLKVDLLITDMIMPEMNGKELALSLAKISPGTKVLYTSGYTSDYIVENGRLEKDIHFLNKPYSMLMLARSVRQILDKKYRVSRTAGKKERNP